MNDLRPHFSHFLSADPSRLHFAAHSHHPWPDVTRAAQLDAWDLAARRMDHKWKGVLGPVWAEAQSHIAHHLNLPDPSSLVFAVNTHEFVLRILSALPERPRILTTTGEFHSFARQIARLEEEGLVEVTRIGEGPEVLAGLIAAAPQGFDLIWVSQVFFGSGLALPIPALAALAEAALMVARLSYGAKGSATGQ